MNTVTPRAGASTHQGPAAVARREAGFSLIEVMVALVVCSIGLLGLAKMESLALASEDVSGTRTVASMQASSLAAMMHANTAYWQSSSATPSAIVTWVSGAVNITDTNLAAVQACLTSGSGSCTPTQMAAYDLQNWGAGLNVLLPGYTATIICTPLVASAPVTCTITINWVENAVAANAQQTSLSTLSGPSYTLNVQP